MHPWHTVQSLCLKEWIVTTILVKLDYIFICAYFTFTKLSENMSIAVEVFTAYENKVQFNFKRV